MMILDPAPGSGTDQALTISLGLSLYIQLYYSLGHFLDEFQRSRFTSGVLDPKVGVWCNVPPFVFFMCIVFYTTLDVTRYYLIY